MEKSIAKYRSAARTYGSSFCHNADASTKRVEEKPTCHSRNIDRRECKKNLKEDCRNNKMTGGFHFRYKEVATTHDGEPQCNRQATRSRSRNLKHGNEKSYQREKRLEKISERTCRDEHVDRNECVKASKDEEKRCTCSAELNERKTTNTGCHGTGTSKNKNGYREKCTEKVIYLDDKNCKSRGNERGKWVEKIHQCKKYNEQHREDMHTKRSPSNNVRMNNRDSSEPKRDKRQGSPQQNNKKYSPNRNRGEDTRCLNEQVGDYDNSPSKLMIRVTARYSPCEDQESTQPNEETCCSCCSDDEDTFYTPASFTVSLKDLQSRTKQQTYNSKAKEQTNNEIKPGVINYADR